MLPIRFGNELPDHFHGDPPQEKRDPIRVALVGTGQWGYQHARALQANPYVKLTSICGRDQARTQHRADQFGAAAYTRLPEMLDREQPELACLCVDNLAHFDATLAVLERGIPALVEKPLVFELDEARRLLAAAEERDLFFAINFNHRYAEPLLRAKQLIDDGELGQIVFASWRFGGNHDYCFDHPHCNLIETQCHGIDMLRNLVGPIEAVSAEMTDITGKDGFGTIVLALRFSEGAVGDLLGSYDTSYAYPDSHRLEINGTRGRLVVEDTCRRLTFNRIDDPVAQVWQPTYFDDEARYFAGSHDRHLADLVRRLRAGLEPPIPARCGYEVLRVCHAAIRSHETGQRVALADIQ